MVIWSHAYVDYAQPVGILLSSSATMFLIDMIIPGGLTAAIRFKSLVEHPKMAVYAMLQRYMYTGNLSDLNIAAFPPTTFVYR